MITRIDNSSHRSRKCGVSLKSNKFWITVICAVLLISASAALLLRRAPANRAYIYQDGELIRTLDLSAVAEPYSFTLVCGDGANTISVEHGRICVSDADCHDRLCVRQGWISGGSVPIVCLPHRLVIKLANSDSSNIDAVVG